MWKIHKSFFVKKRSTFIPFLILKASVSAWEWSLFIILLIKHFASEQDFIILLCKNCNETCLKVYVRSYRELQAFNIILVSSANEEDAHCTVKVIYGNIKLKSDWLRSWRGNSRKALTTQALSSFSHVILLQCGFVYVIFEEFYLSWTRCWAYKQTVKSM